MNQTFLYPLPKNPSIYEINTKILLNELSQKLLKKCKLDDISNEYLDQFIGKYDIIW